MKADENPRSFEEIIISLEKKDEILNKLRNVSKCMEQYKISKLLNDSTASKFVTKSLIKVKDLKRGQYSVSKNIKFKTSILRSDLRDYRDAHIILKGTIDLLAATGNKNNKAQKNVAFKNNSPIRSYISKIKSTLIGQSKRSWYRHANV